MWPRRPTVSSTTRRWLPRESGRRRFGSASVSRTRMTWFVTFRTRSRHSGDFTIAPPVTTVTDVSRRPAALVIAVATIATALGAAVPPASAGHGHGPTAADVAAGRAAVAHREQQVRHAAARVDRARAAVASLASAAEVKVEAYNAAIVRQQAAQRAADAAGMVLDAAAHRVAQARGRINDFAAAAYKSGGMSTVDAMLGAQGPESLVYRVTALQAIAGSQRDAGQALDAARVYQLAVEQRAREVLARARSLTAAAEQARVRAQAAVDAQVAVASRLDRRRHHLAGLLETAQHHASALEQA